MTPLESWRLRLSSGPTECRTQAAAETATEAAGKPHRSYQLRCSMGCCRLFVLLLSSFSLRAVRQQQRNCSSALPVDTFTGAVVSGRDSRTSRNKPLLQRSQPQNEHEMCLSMRFVRRKRKDRCERALIARLFSIVADSQRSASFQNQIFDVLPIPVFS